MMRFRGIFQSYYSHIEHNDQKRLYVPGGTCSTCSRWTNPKSPLIDEVQNDDGLHAFVSNFHNSRTRDSTISMRLSLLFEMDNCCPQKSKIISTHTIRLAIRASKAPNRTCFPSTMHPPSSFWTKNISSDLHLNDSTTVLSVAASANAYLMSNRSFVNSVWALRLFF